MKIGCCAAMEQLEDLETLGFDYIEPNLAKITTMSETQFEHSQRQIENSALKAETFNCMLTGAFNIVGENRNLNAIEQDLKKAFLRARLLGGKVLVLGSGGARRIPDGYDFEKGKKEFICFLQIVNELAELNGLEIVLEPLNKKETNLINRVDEAYNLVQEVALPHIRVLADLYHMAIEQEDFSVFNRVGADLCHVHLANPDGRFYPSRQDVYDYEPFFTGLKKIGYQGRISLECVSKSPQKWMEEAAEGLLFLKQMIL